LHQNPDDKTVFDNGLPPSTEMFWEFFTVKRKLFKLSSSLKQFKGSLGELEVAIPTGLE
jgi:hypothetical protein